MKMFEDCKIYIFFFLSFQFMKSRVEKRRRERMNHSLERLRLMLLQAPRQPVKQQRHFEDTRIYCEKWK